MASQQSNIYNLLSELEAVLDRGFPLLSNYLVVVKRDAVESLVDSIYASLPTEVQNAKSLLKHCDEIFSVCYDCFIYSYDSIGSLGDEYRRNAFRR